MFPTWWRNGLRFYWFTSGARAGRFVPRYDFYRYVEHGLIYQHLQLAAGHRVLDVGAGYSVLPLFLAALRRYEVHIVDNEASLPGIIAFHESRIKKLGLSKDLHDGKVAIERQDARRLSYSEVSFDRILCVSMINTVPGVGDVEIMAEIGRVLRPGGLAIVTVPYGRTYEERQTAPWNPYFTRTYDEAAIQQRLVKPSGLSEVTRSYFGEWPIRVSRMYWLDVPRPVRLMFAFSTPTWTLLCARVRQAPAGASSGVMLVLRKPDP